MTRNIAFVTHSQYPFEPRARRMAETLAAAGYGVDMFCLRHAGEAPEETLNGVHILRLPVARQQGRGGLSYLAEYLRFFLAAAWQLGRRHPAQRYALAQVYNPPDILAFTTLLPRLTSGLRVILDVRDMAPELYQSRFGFGPSHPVTRTLRANERWACAFADAVTVCTTHQFNVQAGRGIPRDKMTIIMNLPDEVIFGPIEPLPPVAADRPDGFTLIYHGGILQRYGLDVLLAALPALRGEIPGLAADIYGAGDFLPAAQTLAQELGVDDIAHFHGYRPLAAMPPLIRQANLGVVPVRRDVFTDTILPTKLMEYAHLGVPAVAARTSTITEYFSNDMVTFFQSGDPADLARQVDALYRDPARRYAQMVSARRFTAAHRWVEEKARYLRLVEQLIG
jgi:glycosyltransferase involved in cell wall biosynthesis